jgi:hypothetical protein
LGFFENCNAQIDRTAKTVPSNLPLYFSAHHPGQWWLNLFWVLDGIWNCNTEHMLDDLHHALHFLVIYLCRTSLVLRYNKVKVFYQLTTKAGGESEFACLSAKDRFLSTQDYIWNRICWNFLGRFGKWCVVFSLESYSQAGDFVANE